LRSRKNSLSPAKIILDALDIILAKVIARLHLDKYKSFRVRRILYTMRVAGCDIERLALFY